MNLFTKQNEGFTLIELLVVIAIIGILSSTVLASLSSARGSSRDASRLAEAKQLMNALESYRTKFGGYPCSSGNLTSTDVNCLATKSNAAFEVVIKDANNTVDTNQQSFYDAINYQPNPDLIAGYDTIFYATRNTGVSNRADRNGYTILVGTEGDSPAQGGTYKQIWTANNKLGYCKISTGPADTVTTVGTTTAVALASIPDCPMQGIK